MTIPPHLAVYLELLHARHGGFSRKLGFAIICQGQVWNISVGCKLMVQQKPAEDSECR